VFILQRSHSLTEAVVPHIRVGLLFYSSHSICKRAFHLSLRIIRMAAAGRTAAKVLGINLDYRKEEPVSSAASISSVETCKCILAIDKTQLTRR
jgi:hypothetical protein